jgi:hypothetical protein
VEESLRAGAHQVLVLPTSASTLYRRLNWLINDDRPFELKGDRYVLAGVEERLALSFPRPVYVAESGSSHSDTMSDEDSASGPDFTSRVRVAPN